jgi:hypothetical protein
MIAFVPAGLVPIKSDQALAIANWPNPAKIGFQAREIKNLKISSDLGHNLSSRLLL